MTQCSCPRGRPWPWGHILKSLASSIPVLGLGFFCVLGLGLEPWVLDSTSAVDFFEFLSTEFAACSKPSSRDNHRKASNPRTQQRDQSAGWTQIIQSGSSWKRRLYPLCHAADATDIAGHTGRLRLNMPCALKFVYCLVFGRLRCSNVVAFSATGRKIFYHFARPLSWPIFFANFLMGFGLWKP